MSQANQDAIFNVIGALGVIDLTQTLIFPLRYVGVGKCRNCESRMKRDGQIPWGKYKDNKFVVISLIRWYFFKAS